MPHVGIDPTPVPDESARRFAVMQAARAHRGCGAKLARSLAEAKRAGRRLDMRHYRCKRCGWHHLTKRQ